MFDPNRFVEECRGALVESDVLAALSSRVAAALLERSALFEAFPPTPRLSIAELHAAPDLAVLVLVCPSGFAFPPHDHRMPSIVGVYAGIEDNVYYRREGRGLVELERRRVLAGEVVAHEGDVIHAIANVAAEPLASIHVYAGDFFGRARSEWKGEPLEERPYDLKGLRRLVETSSQQRGLPNPGIP